MCSDHRNQHTLPLDDIKHFYEQDLPCPELFEAEVTRRGVFWANKEEEQRPTSAISTLKLFVESDFPNIHTLLRIICTIPVTSCECERSASGMRRLHTFNRACMNQDRLTSLAMIHIHYDAPIDTEDMVDKFISARPQWVQKKFLLSE